ncbi:MAG: NAD(P)-dependent oxidoreductase [Bacteroidetes bacterium]|nr:NAD(P)-dependent oxidoreductase [Bacteroidota bacterium]
MRERRIVNQSINKFKLDLGGLRIFTEAATGVFAWTPIIALLSGAETVFAIAKDSRYASKEKARSVVEQLAAVNGCADRLQVVYDYGTINRADIVTNLGAVRPMTKGVVDLMSAKAVIPLMWETWEFREEDLDINACHDRGIVVMGTNEHHPDLNIFSFVGLLGLKMVFEAGLEVRGSVILVVGGGEFGEALVKSLSENGAEVGVVCEEETTSAGVRGRVIAHSLGHPKTVGFLERADAIVFAEHQSERLLVGVDGDLTVPQLSLINGQLKIIHISGLLDATGLRAAHFEVLPQHVPLAARTMSVTLGYLGPKPVIDLHTAGLKVGEELARARRNLVSPDTAMHEALAHPLVNDFSSEMKARYGIA